MIALKETDASLVTKKFENVLYQAKRSWESYYDRADRMFTKVVKAIAGIPYPVLDAKQFLFDGGDFAVNTGSPMVLLQIQLPNDFDTLNKELGGIKLSRSLTDPITDEGLRCSFDASAARMFSKSYSNQLIIRIVD